MNPNDPANQPLNPNPNTSPSTNSNLREPGNIQGSNQNQPLPQAQPADMIDTPAPQINPSAQPTNTINPGNMTIPANGQAPAPSPTPAEPMARPGMPAPNVMPGYANINTGAGTMPMAPKPSRSKKILIVAGSIALASGVAALIFYFAYWTRADVVYSRFQSQIAKITTETLNTNIKLISDINYSLEIGTQSTDLPIKAVAGGRVVGSGSENTADITYSGATINLSADTVNNNNSFDLYVKYKGIQKFYDSLNSKSSTKELASSFGAALPILKKYDDKWITVDLSGLTTAGTNETITQEDYNTVRDKLLPIFKDRFIGLKKAGAVITTTNPKTEKVAGKSAWAYELKISNNNYNAMIDEMVKAVDTTKLSDTKKKILKESLSSQKDAFIDSADSKNGSTTYKIWLEKITGLPLKFSTKSDTLVNGKLSYRDEFVSEITSISSKNIIAKITVSSSDIDENGSVAYSTEFGANLNVDNKTTKIAIDGYYDPDTKKENDRITGKFQLSSASNKAPVTKPTSTIKLEQIVNELNALDEQTSNTDQTTNNTDPTIDNTGQGGDFISKPFSAINKLFVKSKR